MTGQDKTKTKTRHNQNHNHTITITISTRQDTPESVRHESTEHTTREDARKKNNKIYIYIYIPETRTREEKGNRWETKQKKRRGE